MKNCQKSVYLESLGCNRNIVDSEIVLSLLVDRGFAKTVNPEKASYIIVNTCAFIDDAKEETIDTILKLSEYKKNGSKLIVAGCFAQAYPNELLSEMPEVDAIVGVGNLAAVIDAVESKDGRRYYPESRIIPPTYREYGKKKVFLPGKGYAYLKIAEGCNRNCSFCLIPRIKGEQRSRKIEHILEEALFLEESGIQELILTSQDTLNYGTDLGMKNGLKTLVDALMRTTTHSSLRLLYLTPRKELLRFLDIFENPRVIPYFDIPIQHVSRNVLETMNRWGDEHYYAQLVNQIREKVLQAVLRTTLIVGFSGETDEDFNLLYRFVREARFHHLGVFVFSPQQETEAYKLRGRVAKKIACMRKEKILNLQKKISQKMLEKEIGRTFKVLIEERIENSGLYIGRSYHFAPEVDGLFIVHSKKYIEPGSTVHARVTGAESYDLHGECV